MLSSNVLSVVVITMSKMDKTQSLKKRPLGDSKMVARGRKQKVCLL
jgi:hypothetical protein